MTNEQAREQMKKRCSDFNWCVDNDFMVVIRPTSYDANGVGSKECRIVIVKGGITTEGKEFIYKDGTKFQTKTIEGKVLYKNEKEASDACYDVYAMLRERYG